MRQCCRTGRKGAFSLANCITSRDNETIKYACKIGRNKAFRQSEGCFLAEGLKLCCELARALTPLKVFYTLRALENCPALARLEGVHYEITDAVAEKLAETQATQGVFALFALPQASLETLQPGARYVCLENVQDPSNVGAVLRSAAAFGFDGAVLSQGSADAFSGKALRASMGAVAHISVIDNVVMPQLLQTCREKGIVTVAAALQRARPLSEIEPPQGGLALLIGNEGAGLTEDTVASADAVARIPMTDRVESLNAAVAASVLLWHFRGV